MNTKLDLRTQEILCRIGETRTPGARPQLLGEAEGIALIRTQDGVKPAAWAELPASLDLAPLIDHTLLRANAQAQEVETLCDEALAHGFASVCVNGAWVALAARKLQGSPIRVCTVVGFPLGATTSACKAWEAQEAVANGATEVDMVLAVGLAKAGDWEAVRQDMRAVRQAIPGICLKVILETCLLNDAEKRQACRIAVEEGLDFVKTSTGFSTGGATEADIRLMRESVGEGCGVKASGGVRSYAEAITMVRAGATRLGLSSSLVVAQGGTQAGSGY